MSIRMLADAEKGALIIEFLLLTLLLMQLLPIGVSFVPYFIDKVKYYDSHDSMTRKSAN